MPPDFGFIIATHAGDYALAKGAIASLRHFCGDTPICLITDGDLDVRDAVRAFGVSVLRRSEASRPLLRERRSPTKMIAFWDSPFRRFFYLDADAVAWGDLRALSDFGECDMVVDEPAYRHRDEDIAHWFFKAEVAEREYPGFPWRQPRYFCAGVFLGSRGQFSIEDYSRMLDLKAANPGAFFGWDQGILNLMVFTLAHAGRLRVGQRPLQTIATDHGADALRSRFVVGPAGPVITGSPTVLHWPGPKPLLWHGSRHSPPMDYFRADFARRARGVGRVGAVAALLAEDARGQAARQRRLWRRRFERLSAASTAAVAGMAAPGGAATR